jgi:DNA-binding CsgD family transcriptional regulator
MLDEIGMAGFAERARRELAAAGETGRKRTSRAAVGASQELTAQEMQVAQLARDGLSNPEIGARLFISSHIVQYHLSRVFAKLGITPRGQLHRVLPDGPDAPGRQPAWRQPSQGVAHISARARWTLCRCRSEAAR